MSAVRLRVTVTDTWDAVRLDAEPAETLAELKGRALREATGRSVSPDAYVLKYRGGLVLDEHQTVGDLALRDGAPLIVLPAKRQPVR